MAGTQQVLRNYFLKPPNSKAGVYKVVRVELVSEKTDFCTCSWDKEIARKASGQTFSWNEGTTAVENTQDKGDEELGVLPKSLPKILVLVLVENCFPCH